MTKTTPILERTIVCPKCEKKTMRKAIGVKLLWPDMGGREYFCDQCHLYYGIQELVNQWNYDLGDFSDCFPLSVYSIIEKKNGFAQNNGRHPWMNLPIMKEWNTPEEEEDKTWEDFLQDYVTWWSESTLSPNDEGSEWLNKNHRNNSYEVVTRMLLEIPEWEDVSVDTGALHV